MARSIWTLLFSLPFMLLVLVQRPAFAQGWTQGSASVPFYGLGTTTSAGTLYYQYEYLSNPNPGQYLFNVENFVSNGVSYPLDGFFSVGIPPQQIHPDAAYQLPSGYPLGSCTLFIWGFMSPYLSCTSTIYPSAKVISILYAPPGNQSSNGYTDQTTNGTTTTIEQSLSTSDSIDFGIGISAGIFSFGEDETSTISNTQSFSSAFTQTFTNATSISSDLNSNSTYNPTKSDAINHNLDTFVLWLNPLVTVTSQGNDGPLATPPTYNVGLQPISGVDAQIYDTAMIPAIAMEAVPGSINAANPYGISSVPLQILEPQPLPSDVDNPNQAVMPGLAAICQNQTYYPNNCSGDPNGQCGCTPNDFASILAMDPLLNYQGSGTPFPGTVSPLFADNSDATTCAKNPVPSGSDCRYVIVPITQRSTTPLFKPLSGEGKDQFTQTDSISTTLTNGSSTTETDTLKLSGGFAAGLLKVNGSGQLSWSWTDSQSTGSTTGTANSMSVILQTSNVNCQENVNIYEDTVFHTFAFQAPTGITTCN